MEQNAVDSDVFRSYKVAILLLPLITILGLAARVRHVFNFYNGTVRYSVTAGDSVTYRFTGKSLHLVGAKAGSRSRAKIYIDGAYVRTVDAYSAATRYRQRLYYKGWAARGTHTIKIENLATAGRPRFDVDAIGVER